MESVVSVLVFSELHVALGASNCFQFVSDDGKSQLPLAGSSEYDTTGSGVQDPASGGPRGPGSHGLTSLILLRRGVDNRYQMLF